MFGRDRRGRTTTKPFPTRIFTPGTEVKMDFRYKHSRIKQYLKEGRALRIETVINKPSDIGILARLEHLPELVAKARGINGRLLTMERAGQGCAIGSALFERIHQPYIREGQRTGALRFGDPRAMALTGALCCFVHAVAGFTNKSLRGLVAGLLGRDYTTSQMTYDLRRLRLHGLIERIPRTNTYILTPDGLRVAIFYNKVHDRLLRPLIAAARPTPAPVELRRALATIDRVIADYADNARLAPPRETCRDVHEPRDQEDLTATTPPTATAPGPQVLACARGHALGAVTAPNGPGLEGGVWRPLVWMALDYSGLPPRVADTPSVADAGITRWARAGIASTSTRPSSRPLTTWLPDATCRRITGSACRVAAPALDG